MQKRTLSELMNTADPAWPLVLEWVKTARNNVEVLPEEREVGEAVLLHLQVTTRSPMGAIALESGGILIDHGWLRFLGAGHRRICGSLLTWNSQSNTPEHRSKKDALIVAYDVVGGFFAVNGGAFSGKPGTVYYFAPESLQWENTKKSYSDLLQWAFSEDISLFYESMRWPGWEHDVSALSGDQGMSIYPFVCMNREIPIAKRSRHAVSLYELWDLYQDLAQQLEHLPPGTPVRFSVKEDYREN